MVTGKREIRPRYLRAPSEELGTDKGMQLETNPMRSRDGALAHAASLQGAKEPSKACSVRFMLVFSGKLEYN